MNQHLLIDKNVNISQIPSGLVEGWTGIVYSFQTNMAEPDAEIHMELVTPEIQKIVSDSFDHWQELRPEKKEAVVWEPWNQVTLVQFYVRDSY